MSAPDAPVESRHLVTAHAVIVELQKNPRVSLEQIDGKDIIAQAIANASRGFGLLRELARMVQRVVPSTTEPDTRALLLMVDDVLLGRLPGSHLRSTSTVAAVAPPITPWTPEPGVKVRVEGSPYKHLNGLVGKVMGRHVMHPNPNLWEVKIEVNGAIWNLDATWLIAAGPPLHLETDPQLLLDAVRGAVVDHIRTGDSGHLRDAVSGIVNLVEQLLKRRECP